VAVREVVAVFPHASVAVHVRACERKHPLLCSGPSTGEETVAPAQPSVAVAEPSAASIAAVVGLHPRGVLLPEALIVGAVISTVHVTARNVVAVLPQASVAVNVLVWERRQPLLERAGVFAMTVGVLHPSVALALPNAASMSAEVGLQPSTRVVPVAVIVGPV